MKQSNKMKKRILIFACLFAVINLYGQQSAPSASSGQAPSENAGKTCNKHEISVWGAGGFSTLYYSPNDFGDWSPQLGGAFGLGYTFYFSKYFGILAGGELAFYNAKMKVDGLTDNFDIVDRTGIIQMGKDEAPVNFRTKFNGYEETQHLMNVNIPIALQFQTGGEHKFFASLGFKLGIPVSGSYKNPSNSILKTTGFYYDIEQEFIDPAYLGYGEFKGTGNKKDLDFNLAYMGTAEAGIKWKLSEVLSLYTGAYFEYGFNDAVKSGHGERFLVYNENDPGNFTTNSTLTSQYTSNGKTGTFVDRASPAAVGIKLRLGVNLCQKEKGEKEVKPAPTPKPAPAPAPAPKPAPAPAPAPEQVTPAPAPKPKPIAPPRTRTEEFDQTLSDEEIIESLQRLVSEYGSSVKGAYSIQMSGEGIEQYLAGYDLNQSSLSSNMKKILDAKIADIRAKHGTNVSIIVEGHTCNIGTEAANMRVGQRRADVVRDYLISKGFNAQKITAVSKGQSIPIAPNTTEANRRTNRRVVLVVTD